MPTRNRRAHAEGVVATRRAASVQPLSPSSPFPTACFLEVRDSRTCTSKAGRRQSMLTFCARCPALVERLLASGSARLGHLPGALRWLQKGPRLRPLLDGPGWSRTTARRFEGRQARRQKGKVPATNYIPRCNETQRFAGDRDEPVRASVRAPASGSRLQRASDGAWRARTATPAC